MEFGMRLGYPGVGQQGWGAAFTAPIIPPCSPNQQQLRVPGCPPRVTDLLQGPWWGQSLLAELGTVASEAEGEVNPLCPCKASPAGWVAPGQEPSLLSVTRHHLPVPSLGTPPCLEGSEGCRTRGFPPCAPGAAEVG